MTVDELRERIAQALEIQPSDLKEDSSQSTISSWDSMAALEIITILDDAYGGEITEDDARAFSTFGGIVSFAREKGILTD